jgi:hypothetical protein
MMRSRAEQFEKELQQAGRGLSAEGRLAPLVDAARWVATQSEPPPAPPHGLMPGRQRFLAEAARLRAERAPRRLLPVRAMRLATALALAAILFGAALGAERATAASLPGQPLYSVKLAAESTRLALTGRPASRAALALALAEERLDEIVALLEQRKPIETEAWNRAERQLESALETAVGLEDPAAAPALGRLAEALRQREQAMLGLAGESPEPRVGHLLSTMEQVRREAYAGEGDPNGLRGRLRRATPPAPAFLPDPSQTPLPSRTPGRPPTLQPPMPSPTGTPGPSRTPKGAGAPGQTPKPSATPMPTSPHASRTPGPSATSQPSEPPHASRTPGSSGTPDPTGGPPLTPGPWQTPGSGGKKQP